jgi:UMF1 family MFS transporter
MSPSALILVGVLTPSAGIAGSLLWPMLQRRFGWSNLKILVILVIMASLIPAYGCLGFIFQGRVRFGGLTTQGEMFGLAVYFGAVYGAFQGYARAFYAELLPPGEEARWYGLFSITDKVRLIFFSPSTNLTLYSSQARLLARSWSVLFLTSREISAILSSSLFS